MQYARSENGIVVHLLRVDPATIYGPAMASQYRECPDEVEVGWLDNGETFTAPPPAPEPGADYRITRLAFRNRFLPAEKVTLELASLDNPAGPLLARQQAAALRAYLADVAAATFVDLSRADTRAGVQYLETVTLIAAGRAAAILDAPIQAEERPVFLGV